MDEPVKIKCDICNKEYLKSYIKKHNNSNYHKKRKEIIEWRLDICSKINK